MGRSIAISAAAATALLSATLAGSAAQVAGTRSIDEATLRQYTGAYPWAPDAFVYLQIWNEFTGSSQLVAFDESGDVRTLFPGDVDRFFTGPGAAVQAPVESRIESRRDAAGTITSLTWQRGSEAPRVARRADIERREDVRFSNGAVQLSGTLFAPHTGEKHPAIILVHGSGPQNREALLPFARFLVRHGMAVLGYDKRGVGGSTGSWNTASFDDLAGDVIGAFEYLKTRSDIDGTQIGLLGVSQAGWIMPLAAVRAKEIAFLISVSGPGVPAAETTIDHARNEMTSRGMAPQTVNAIIGVMQRQYEFARTGEGWDEYLRSRAQLIAGLGQPPPGAYPDTPDHPYWHFIRRIYFYDPAPTLRQLQVPTLALFGELDNNVLADKNSRAWEAALRTGGNRDYSLVTLPRANHIQMEATIGSNAEIPTLRRFVPEYFSTIHDWLAKRVRGIRARA
jgi:pimeloyl-ACP methyl ester carboxylesterase